MEKKEKFPLIYLFLIVMQAFSSLSFYMSAPLITKYLTGIGSTLAMAGLLSGILSYVCLVVRPFSGLLADRWNPRYILVTAFGLFGLSVVGYGCTGQIGLFFALRVLSGISFAFGGTTIFAYAGHFIPKSRMGEGVGYLGMGNVVASAIGPVFGNFLAENAGYRISFGVAGMISILPALILWFWVPKEDGATESKEAKVNSAVSNQIHFQDIFAVELVPIAIFGSLFSYAHSTMSNFLLLFADWKGIGQASFYFSVLALFLVILRPLAGKVNDRYGLRYVLVPGILCSIVGVGIILYARSLWMILLAAIFMAFGQGSGPAIQAECMKKAGTARSGVATSTYYIFSDISQGVSPTIGGALAGYFGYSAAFFLCIGLFVAGLLYYMVHFRKADGR